MSIFDEINQLKSWKRTEKFLLEAKSFSSLYSLNETQIQILKDFDEFIVHNELGLAYEQLIYLSETADFPTEFWQEMFLAAKEMKLEDEIERCKSNLE